MITFFVEGQPRGKARPRINTFTKRAYTPTITKLYEEVIGLRFQERYKNFTPLECALEVEIKAIFEIPKSYSKKKRAELLGKEHTKKPDADNISKCILDSLNGLAYKDDSQIAKLTITKQYGENVGVLVMIKKI